MHRSLFPGDGSSRGPAAEDEIYAGVLEPSADDVKSEVMDCESSLPGNSFWVLVPLAGPWVGLILEREATGQEDDQAAPGRKASEEAALAGA